MRLVEFAVGCAAALFLPATNSAHAADQIEPEVIASLPEPGSGVEGWANGTADAVAPAK